MRALSEFCAYIKIILGLEKSWPTNMNITNPKTFFPQVQHFILFYIISE